jgi:hypothetical protein
MMLRPLLITALATALATPALATITYPIDVDATRGQWALVRQAGGTWTVFRRNADWPIADGSAVTGMAADYRWVQQVRIEPPEIDSRLQEVIYPCPEVIDVVAETLTTTCVATLRPVPELVAAVTDAAQQRIIEALTLLGLQDPTDLWRVVAMLTAERAGQTLTAEQDAWLDDVGAVARAYVDAVRARQAEITAWVEAHPDQVPSIGPAEWPPLPVLPE